MIGSVRSVYFFFNFTLQCTHAALGFRLCNQTKDFIRMNSHASEATRFSTSLSNRRVKKPLPSMSLTATPHSFGLCYVDERLRTDGQIQLGERANGVCHARYVFSKLRMHFISALIDQIIHGIVRLSTNIRLSSRRRRALGAPTQMKPLHPSNTSTSLMPLATVSPLSSIASR